MCSESKVSIIVPVYNKVNVLNHCIDSLLEQTYKKIEIILVDDGSQDGSLELCNEFAKKDKRIIIIHKDNGGVGSARNKGIEKASGEFIIFVDSDDYVSKYYIEGLMEPIFKESVDIAVCNFQHIKFPNYINFTKPTFDYVIDNVSPKVLRQSVIARVCGCAFRKSVLKDVRFDTDLFVGEDLLFFCRCLNNCKKIALVNDALYCYVLYEESLSHGFYDERKFSEMISWSRVISLFKEKPQNFKNSIHKLYGWVVFSNIHRFLLSDKIDVDKYELLKHELRSQVRYVLSPFTEGDKKSILHKGLYLFTCLNPILANKIWQRIHKIS